MDFLFENLTTKQTVLKNTFWLYLGNFSSRIFKLLIIILAARYLGPEGYGQFAYILSIVGFFFIFVDWGSSFLFIREYQNIENKINLLNNYYSFRMLLLAISLISIFLGFFIFKDLYSQLLFLIIYIFSFTGQIKNIFTVVFNAIKKMQYDGLSILIESFFIFIFTIFLVKSFREPIYLSISYFMGILISTIYVLIIINKIFPLKNFKFSSDKFKYFLINGTPLLFFGILGFIFFSTDHIILGKLRGYEELGYYSVASKVILNFNLIISFFLGALLPHLAEFKNDFERIKKILNKVFLTNFFVYLGLILIAFILSQSLLNFFLGSKYEASIGIFKFLLFYTLLLSFISILDNILFIYNYQWQNFFITLICAVLNLILNLILIPYQGMYGAALATYFSQTLNLILSYYLVKKILKI
ncbi:MAG: oligosaccharide flippase family protein [Patescibacteria group bacterium]|nr:oligosaccharide flippase family protein [Patescibacteria group bacterium]